MQVSFKDRMISEKSTELCREENKGAVSPDMQQQNDQRAKRVNPLYKLNFLHTSLTGKADNKSDYGEPVKENETNSVSKSTEQSNHHAVSRKRKTTTEERERSETAEK